MKKVLLSMMTAAMFFASCSSDETAVPENNGTAENNQEELVAIKLGTGSRVGTTVVESRAIDEWDANQIGVFALDRNEAWDTSIDTNDRPVLLNNELGTVGNELVDDETSQIEVVWTNAVAKNTTLYYPRYSTRKYSFFAYHPYVEDASNIDVQTTSVTVKGTFDGTQDIMVGKAICASEQGYNAKYFRDLDKSNSYQAPDIKFEHLTTRLLIKVAPGHKYDPATCTIQSLSMAVPNGYTMRVASTDLENTPQGITSWNDETVTTEFAKDIALTEATPGMKDYQTSEVVADILTKPTENGGDGYELILTLPGINEPIIAPVKLNNTSALFNAGSAYSITLTINGPQEIEVTASLTPWYMVGGEIGVEI